MDQVSAAIRREIDDARAAERPVASVRVTAAGLKGVVAAVSLSPERAEALDLDKQMAEAAVEILVHPDDYEALLEEPTADLTRDASSGMRLVCGVPLID